MSISIVAQRGFKGPTVVRIQKDLNKLAGAKLEPDGDFGSATEEAVKSFQRDQALMDDGIVGEFTDTALQLGTLAKSLPRVPKHVRQKPMQCWAAATESWLSVQPHRRKYTMDQIVKSMQEEGAARLSDGALLASEQWRWEDIVGLRPIVESRTSFYAEKALLRLQFAGIPLMIGLGGAVGHVMVMYGVMVSGMDVQLLVMDPMSSSHPAAWSVADIRKGGGTIVTWMPKPPLIL